MASLIIAGHQSSGTTLLVRLCNSHPDITVTMEFGNFLCLGKPYITYLGRMLKRWAGIGIRHWPLTWPATEVWRSISKWQRLMTILQNNAFVARYLFKIHRYRRERIGVSAIEATLQSFFPRIPIVGDKYPDYVFKLDELAGTDELSTVVIYRDCRDVTSSTFKRVLTEWCELPFFIKKLDTAEKGAKRWVGAIELMERCKEQLHLIRYEDLVKNKELELKALGQWLGVDPTGFDANVIEDNRIGRYKSRLSDEELATVMEIAGTTMARLGYL